MSAGRHNFHTGEELLSVVTRENILVKHMYAGVMSCKEKMRQKREKREGKKDDVISPSLIVVRALSDGAMRQS